MKPYRVLSIDWDYLINASMEERIKMFPDSGNEQLHSYIQDIVWSTRYASNKEITSIGIDKNAVNIINKFVSKYCNESTCVVWDSHANLFDEVISEIHFGQPLQIINIDFHHDSYENNPKEVDCGNWVNSLFDGYYKKPHKDDYYWWIKREDSDDYFDEPKEYRNSITIDELLKFKRFKCDLLFICRSSMWSPPHLDNEFEEFYKTIGSKTKRLEINISGSRYNKLFKKSVEDYRKLISTSWNSSIIIL